MKTLLPDSRDEKEKEFLNLFGGTNTTSNTTSKPDSRSSPIKVPPTSAQIPSKLGLQVNQNLTQQSGMKMKNSPNSLFDDDPLFGSEIVSKIVSNNIENSSKFMAQRDGNDGKEGKEAGC